RPISAVPNAGLPKDVGDRKIYLASPEYMAGYARRMIEAGARIVGGCCGTTPEHIKKMRDYVASVVPRHQPVVQYRATIATPAAQPAPRPAGGRTDIARTPRDSATPTPSPANHPRWPPTPRRRPSATSTRSAPPTWSIG